MVDTLLTDGAGDFLGGQDASKIPDRIPANCYAAGVNVSVKKGSLRPRWGDARRALSFESGGIKDYYQRIRTYREIFRAGKFQAFIPYVIGMSRYTVVVVSGFIFLVNIDTYEVTHIEIEGGSRLNSRARRLNWTPAGKYLVIYDFPAYPVILEGLTARRADPDAMEIPVATQGVFNENRLVVANAGNEFTAGDPVGNPLTPDAPISFQEVMTIGSPYFGQLFSTGTASHNDPITYVGFLQVTDSSTEIGPTIIGTSRAVYAYNTQNVRSSWDQQKFGSCICYNAGIVGPRAFCNTNSDAFFLSADGYVRALSQSRDEQHKWSRVPMSREVENWFLCHDASLKSLAFVSYFGNKIFFSVNPYRTSVVDFESTRPISDYAHGGMAVMELDNFVSMGDTTKATWAGLWTGVRPMDMATFGDDRAFIIAKDSSNVNELYEILPNQTYDSANGKVRYIRSKVYTKEYDFKDPHQNKELHSLDVNFDTLQGDFSFNVQFKPSHSPYFYPWYNFERKIPWRTCGIPTGCELNGYAPQMIRDFTIGAPTTDECDKSTDDLIRIFKKIQLQLTLEGKYWEIHEYRVKAAPVTTSPNQNERLCEEYPAVVMCEQCNDDWKVEEFEGCLEKTT